MTTKKKPTKRVKKILPWIKVANGMMGTKEVRGKRNNPTIMAWAKLLSSSVKKIFHGDVVPWCGLAMAYIYGPRCDCKIPKTPLWAKSWARFGFGLLFPRKGCLGVFKRPGGGGHVGIIIGCTSRKPGVGYYYVQGGNQSDSFNITRIRRNRCIAWRWPSEYRHLLTKDELPILKSVRGARISVNEK